MGSEVQAVIFNKTYWTPEKASKWLSENGYKPLKRVHRTANFLRYRIRDPSKYTHFSTKKLPDHLDLIIGYTRS
jgi:hypothetical protein